MARFGPFWPLHVQNAKTMQLSLFLNFSGVKIIRMVAQDFLKVFQLTELEKLESFVIYDFESIKKKNLITHKRFNRFEWNQVEHLLNIFSYYW